MDFFRARHRRKSSISDPTALLIVEPPSFYLYNSLDGPCFLCKTVEEDQTT